MYCIIPLGRETEFLPSQYSGGVPRWTYNIQNAMLFKNYQEAACMTWTIPVLVKVKELEETPALLHIWRLGENRLK